MPYKRIHSLFASLDLICISWCEIVSHFNPPFQSNFDSSATIDYVFLLYINGLMNLLFSVEPEQILWADANYLARVLLIYLGLVKHGPRSAQEKHK